MGHRLNLDVITNSGKTTSIYLHWGAQPSFINKLKNFEVKESELANAVIVADLYENESSAGDALLNRVMGQLKSQGIMKEDSDTIVNGLENFSADETYANFIKSNVTFDEERNKDLDQQQIKFRTFERDVVDYLFRYIKGKKVIKVFDIFAEVFGRNFKENPTLKELYDEFDIWNPAYIKGNRIIVSGFWNRELEKLGWKNADDYKEVLVCDLKDLDMTDEEGWGITVDGIDYGFSS